MKYNAEWRSDWIRKATTTVAKASAERDSSELLIASAAAELEHVKASLTSEAEARLTAPSTTVTGARGVFQHKAVE
jgi:hypothetical protein